ncbi:MAG: PEP-CTERM sorting domain-containing protein [Pirellulales bacterium]|nr:PEP-CTERM sorting domain-containing protein [Pirellulales bacterium]
MIQKSHWLVVASLLVVNWMATPVHAVPITTTLTLDSSQSFLTLHISAANGLITAAPTTSVSGVQDVTTEGRVFGTHQDFDSLDLALSGGDWALEDTETFIDFGSFLGGVVVGNLGISMHGLTTSGFLETDPDAVDFGLGYFADYYPTDVVTPSSYVDSGLMTYTGTGAIGGLIGSGTLDFSGSPFDLPLLPAHHRYSGVGFFGDRVSQSGQNRTYAVTLALPVSFAPVMLMTSPIDVSATLQGYIVATGLLIYNVPEPSTIVLLAIALCGLIPLWRRLGR